MKIWQYKFLQENISRQIRVASRHFSSADQGRARVQQKSANSCATACNNAEKAIAHSMLETITLFREEGRRRSPTFAYWESFLEAGDILLKLLRADREADFLLHLEAVMQTVPYCVLAGRTNYARFTPVYVAEMKKLEETHPLMYLHMKEGGFVVRRSGYRKFNCVPTDQALEQTINREAKSRGGVIGYTLRKGALLRWLTNRHITGEYAACFKQLSCNGNENRLHEELHCTRLNRDKQDVSNIKEFLESQCQNPFTLENEPDHLINITTGQVASQEVEKSLKGVSEKGKTVVENFFKDRLGNEPTKSFWDPMKRNTVITFSDMKKALPNDKERKLIIDTEILFRRLLGVAKSREVDLKYVLQHELAAVPPAVFHDDGRMRKTNKSDLLEKLESNCQEILTILPQISEQISSAYVIDGMGLIQSLDENQFCTFNDLAEIVKKRVVKLLWNPSLNLKCVTIVFDRYDNKSSIKNNERELRGAIISELPKYHIQGDRAVPNYRAFLKVSSNKASLVEFVCSYITENGCKDVPGGKSVILAGGFADGKQVKSVTALGVTSQESLYSNQEEADCRIIMHCCILSHECGRIIVRCDDTDVLVLLVYYTSKGYMPEEVYMHTGHSVCIPVQNIVTKLGHLICECLPAAHALTGCDTTCSLYIIGKRTAYSSLVKHAATLTKLSTFHEDSIDDSICAARKFALLLYGGIKTMNMDTLDELRYNVETTTDKISAMLPPTEDSFKQHVLRAKYQARLWCNSHISMQDNIDPVRHGWSLCDGTISPTLFTLNPAPMEVRDLTHLYCSDKKCLSGRKCPCVLAGLDCIDACSCTNCMNQNKLQDETCQEEEFNVFHGIH